MAPYIRIALRYGVGALFSYQLGDMLANDPDVIEIATAGVTALLGAATEVWYRYARKNGGNT